MEITSRAAVRVVCLDAAQRVLMMCWRDPRDGTLVWEPPGGGVEPGETPFAAARRELAEETGLDPARILDSPVTVHRDMIWNGRRVIGPEQFFLARFAGDEPSISRHGLLAYEEQILRASRWVAVDDLSTLDGNLEPPLLADVVSTLVSLTQ